MEYMDVTLRKFGAYSCEVQIVRSKIISGEDTIERIISNGKIVKVLHWTKPIVVSAVI